MVSAKEPIVPRGWFRGRHLNSGIQLRNKLFAIVCLIRSVK